MIEKATSAEKQSKMSKTDLITHLRTRLRCFNKEGALSNMSLQVTDVNLHEFAALERLRLFNDDVSDENDGV